METRGRIELYIVDLKEKRTMPCRSFSFPCRIDIAALPHGRIRYDAQLQKKFNEPARSSRISSEFHASGAAAGKFRACLAAVAADI